jgi:NADH:ubiquinone oxidoreductase subunit E
VCAIGPVMMVDRKFYGEMNSIRAKKIIEKLNNKRRGVKK